MSVARCDITKARALLAKTVLNLTAAASGEVVARVGAAIQSQIDAVSTRILTKHKRSGNALASQDTTLSGSLIQLSAPAYVGFGLRSAWPFRSGMPPFVITRAVKIAQAELVAALAGRRSPLLLADEAAEEKAAEKSRAAFKKETARIWRQSAEGKAARAAARKAAKK